VKQQKGTATGLLLISNFHSCNGLRSSGDRHETVSAGCCGGGIVSG